MDKALINIAFGTIRQPLIEQLHRSCTSYEVLLNTAFNSIKKLANIRHCWIQLQSGLGQESLSCFKTGSKVSQH